MLFSRGRAEQEDWAELAAAVLPEALAVPVERAVLAVEQPELRAEVAVVVVLAERVETVQRAQAWH